MFATAQDIVAKKYAGCHTTEDAEALLQRVLDDALNNRQDCKCNRPWEIVDFAKKLPNDEPWIGFEFETGFDNKADYQKFIHWLWQQDYVAIDREGTGKYPVEVAFPPQALSDVQQNSHLLQRSVEFIHANKLTPALNPTTFTRRDVGIHAGISTPKWRALRAEQNYNRADSVVNKLAHMLDNLSSQQKDELYGRHQLYWGTANNRHSYVELKMFRAIPEADRVSGYIDVAIRCTQLLDWCIDNKGKKLTQEQTYNFLSGKTNNIGE